MQRYEKSLTLASVLLRLLCCITEIVIMCWHGVCCLVAVGMEQAEKEYVEYAEYVLGTLRERYPADDDYIMALTDELLDMKCELLGAQGKQTKRLYVSGDGIPYLERARTEGWLDDEFQPKGLDAWQRSMLAERIGRLMGMEKMMWHEFELLWGINRSTLRTGKEKGDSRAENQEKHDAFLKKLNRVFPEKKIKKVIDNK